MTHGQRRRNISKSRRLTCDISFPPNPSICYAYPTATAYRTHKPDECFTIVWWKMDKKELYQWVENGNFNADIYTVIPDDGRAMKAAAASIKEEKKL